MTDIIIMRGVGKWFHSPLRQPLHCCSWGYGKQKGVWGLVQGQSQPPGGPESWQGCAGPLCPCRGTGYHPSQNTSAPSSSGSPAHSNDLHVEKTGCEQGCDSTEDNTDPVENLHCSKPLLHCVLCSEYPLPNSYTVTVDPGLVNSV